jgi:dipeptidyl aminopeptidase/acylaminoacyl peptidase
MVLLCASAARSQDSTASAGVARHLSDTAGARRARAGTVGRPLAVGDIVRSRSLAADVPIEISPDGRWLAYTVLNPMRRADEDSVRGWYGLRGEPWGLRGAEVWVVNMATGERHDVTGPRGESWGAAWSPDGRMLAFYSTRSGVQQVWVWSVATAQCHRAADAVARPDFSFQMPEWTPDGRRLIAKFRVADSIRAGSARPRPTEDVRVLRTVRPTSDSNEYVDSSEVHSARVDLAAITLATGQVQRLVTSAPVRGYRVSPTGHSVAFMTTRTRTDSRVPYDSYNLGIVEIAGGAPHQVVAGVNQEIGSELSWSPDGTMVAFTNWADSDPAHGGCYVVAASGGAPRQIAASRSWSCGGGWTGPLWSADGTSVYLLANDTLWAMPAQGGSPAPIAGSPRVGLRSIVGLVDHPRKDAGDTGAQSVIVTIRDSATIQSGIARVSLSTGEVRTVFAEDGAVKSSDDFGTASRDGTVAYIWETAQLAPDIWVVDSVGARRRLTHVAPALDNYAFGGARLLSWLSADGTRLRGTLRLPTGYTAGQRYPLIVVAYGGATFSNDVNTFSLGGYALVNAQLLQTRGYALLAPDQPLHAGSAYRDLATDVLPAINAVVDLGVADSTRVGVVGVSYGAYSTLSLITQTPRFRAAVSYGGVYNLFTEYGWIRPNDNGMFGSLAVEGGQGGMRATPWERRDRYIDNSPYFFLDRITAPVLIAHGTLDQATPVFGAEELFVALHRLEKTATLVEYPNELHQALVWSVPHEEDLYNRCLAWFDRYLNGRVADEVGRPPGRSP